MSNIQTQIDRIVQAKADLIAQIAAKGVTVPADASIDDLAALVQAIKTGGELKYATGSVTVSGKTFGATGLDFTPLIVIYKNASATFSHGWKHPNGMVCLYSSSSDNTSAVTFAAAEGSFSFTTSQVYIVSPGSTIVWHAYGL